MILVGSCGLLDRLPTLGYLVTCHLERGNMPLHDADRVNCKNGPIADIKAQAPSIWTKEQMLNDCACVI